MAAHRRLHGLRRIGIGLHGEASGLLFAQGRAAMLRIQDAILNSLGLSFVVAGIAAIDKDVRGHFLNIVSGDSARELALIAVPADRFGRAAVQSLRDHGIDNELLAFAVAAVVLFIVLFRS